MHMMFLLRDQVTDKGVPLEDVRVDDLVRWCHVDYDVPHNIHQKALRLFAELDPGELQQPL